MRVATAHAAGAIAGATVTASMLLVLNGLASPIPATARVIALVTAVAFLAAHEHRLIRITLPNARRQIPRTVFHDHPERAAARFAFELGLGFRTWVTTSAPWVLVAALVLMPHRSAWAAVGFTALAATGFGLGRSMIVLRAGFSRRPQATQPSARGVWVASALTGAATLIAVATMALTS